MFKPRWSGLYGAIQPHGLGAPPVEAPNALILNGQTLQLNGSDLVLGSA